MFLLNVQLTSLLTEIPLYWGLAMRKQGQQLNYTPQIWRFRSIDLLFHYNNSLVCPPLENSLWSILLVLWHLIKQITEFMQYTVTNRCILSLSSKTNIGSKTLMCLTIWHLNGDLLKSLLTRLTRTFLHSCWKS